MRDYVTPGTGTLEGEDEIRLDVQFIRLVRRDNLGIKLINFIDNNPEIAKYKGVTGINWVLNYFIRVNILGNPGAKKSIITKLVKNGANVNEYETDNVPLSYALTRRDIVAVNSLLKNGADIYFKYKNVIGIETTPLSESLILEPIYLCKLLEFQKKNLNMEYILELLTSKNYDYSILTEGHIRCIINNMNEDDFNYVNSEKIPFIIAIIFLPMDPFDFETKIKLIKECVIKSNNKLDLHKKSYGYTPCELIKIYLINSFSEETNDIRELYDILCANHSERT